MRNGLELTEQSQKNKKDQWPKMELPGPLGVRLWEAGIDLVGARKVWGLTRWAEGRVQSRHRWRAAPPAWSKSTFPTCPRGRAWPGNCRAH
jgi:hypothetical protein